MKTKIYYLKIGLMIAIILFTGSIYAQTEGICNGPNMLSGKMFRLDKPVYCPVWISSDNYTCTLVDDKLILHLGDATFNVWQAQFFLFIDPAIVLKTNSIYCISFDIETNVDLPRAFIKFFRDGNDNRYIELGGYSVKKGKQTVSGTFNNTGIITVTQIDKLLFDFGGNPANADITISNIALHGEDATSIVDISNDNYTIFPNPVKDIIHIQGLQGDTRIRVLNVSGIVCINQITNEKIDISGLAQGIYFLVTDNRTFKIIKQ